MTSCRLRFCCTSIYTDSRRPRFHFDSLAETLLLYTVTRTRISNLRIFTYKRDNITCIYILRYRNFRCSRTKGNNLDHKIKSRLFSLSKLIRSETERVSSNIVSMSATSACCVHVYICIYLLEWISE